MAINKPEYSGHVRGVGGTTTPTSYWGKSSQSRKEAELQSQKHHMAILEQNKLLAEQVRQYAEERKIFEERLRNLEQERREGWSKGPSFQFPPDFSTPFQQWQQTHSYHGDFSSQFHMPQPHYTPQRTPFQVPQQHDTPHPHQVIKSSSFGTSYYYISNNNINFTIVKLGDVCGRTRSLSRARTKGKQRIEKEGPETTSHTSCFS